MSSKIGKIKTFKDLKNTYVSDKVYINGEIHKMPCYLVKEMKRRTK